MKATVVRESVHGGGKGSGICSLRFMSLDSEVLGGRMDVSDVPVDVCVEFHAGRQVQHQYNHNFFLDSFLVAKPKAIFVIPKKRTE